MRHYFPIVGVGASAGGLEAVTELLRALPPRPGISFVLVQHRSPTVASHLSTILSKFTQMVVSEAKAGEKVCPDCLYIVPPQKDVVIQNGSLRLLPRPDKASRHSPIDLFLGSLAKDIGPRAIGIILSGEASDGTAGLKAVKGAGGITFAQDRESAGHPSMPASAAASGCVDFILPPENIAKELLRISRYPSLEGGPPTTRVRLPHEEGLRRIFTLLRAAAGSDFSHYKQSTIHRRIRRRMALKRLDTFEAYAALLEKQREELDLLFNDLLIHVTHFFRDPAMFKALKNDVYPRLLRDRRSQEAGPIRIWIPGCSSGEEVYSHAINIMEFLKNATSRITVQIFATDVNEKMLSQARHGWYPEQIVGALGQNRIKRFFVPKGHGYQISKPLRDLCVFARQDLTRDPPFSNMDLVSCRNMLIYFDSELQKKVVSFLNYALKPGRFLVLGSSELLSDPQDFLLLDKKNKIFSKKPGAASAPIRPVNMLTQPILSTALSSALPALQKESGPQQADRILLEDYTPASVLINDAFEILQFRGRTAPFLEPAPGKASLNLLKMAREGLAPELSSAVREARQTSAPVRAEGICFRDGKQEKVAFEIVPLALSEAGRRCFLVLFAQSAKAPQMAQAVKASPRRIHGLKRELASIRRDLRIALEHQESTNEELKSANEEILSNNEELQSTNEELETTKEELQSSNEELQTSNEDLNKTILELTLVNNDLTNFLATTQIPCIMLNDDLTIRRFTPAAAKIFNLISGDIGRPISHLRPALADVDFRRLAVETLNGLRVPRQDVRDRRGHWYSMLVHPYRTEQNKVDGVVIVLLNIDEQQRGLERLLRSQRTLAQNEAVLQQITDNTPGLIIRFDHALRCRYINARSVDFLGISKKNALGRHFRSLFGNALFRDKKSVILKSLSHAEPSFEYSVAGPKGIWHGLFSLLPDKLDKTAPRSGLLVLVQNMTDQQNVGLRHIVESAPTGILLIDKEGRIALVNSHLEQLFGYKREDLLKKPVESLVPLKLRPQLKRQRRSFIISRSHDLLISQRGLGLKKDGTTFPIEVSLSRIRPSLIMATVVDITQRLKLLHAESLRASVKGQQDLLADLSHELKTPIATLRTSAETLLRRGFQYTRNTPEFLQTIVAQTQKLSKLVDNLIQLSRQGRRMPPPLAKRFSFSELVQRSIRELSFLAQEKNILLRSQIERGISIRANRNDLRQAVENLIDNAIQYNHSEGKVEVSLRRNGRDAHLRVCDTGIGMARSAQAKLFQRFYRIPRATKLKPSGTGLGLAIVKQVADHHNGRVWAESRPGTGSTFHLRLPLD